MINKNIYIDEDYLKAYKRLARNEGMACNEYIRKVLKDHLYAINEAPEQKDQSWRFKNWN